MVFTYRTMKKVITTTLLATVLTSTVALAEGRPFDTVQTKDWEYQALMTLVKHGAITDLHGIELGQKTYMRYELTPLISDVVDKRETMNENDRMIAVRLYDLYRRDILNYRVQQEEEQRLKEMKKDAIEGKDIDLGKDEQIVEPEKKILSPKELKEKMDKFSIDDSAIVSGDARIRVSNRGRIDGRTRVQFTIGGRNGSGEAPSALVDYEGRKAIAEADEELKAMKESRIYKDAMKKQKEEARKNKEEIKKKNEEMKKQKAEAKRIAQAEAKKNKEAMKKQREEEKQKQKEASKK